VAVVRAAKWPSPQPPSGRRPTRQVAIARPAERPLRECQADLAEGDLAADAARRAERIRLSVRCLRVAMLLLVLVISSAGCSRGAAQGTDANGGRSQPPDRGPRGGLPGSGLLHYPRVVTGYGGPLLSLPDTGSFDWLCTGPTGATRRFHVRYTATTNEHIAVVELGGPTLDFRPNQPGSVIAPPAQPAGPQSWRIRHGGENGTTSAEVRFRFAVIGGACIVRRTTASRTFVSTTG
jgi:hypothetical protein